MDFKSKIISREISQLLWEREKSLGTAESCTGGRIAEAIIAIPGASKYFKGGIVSYADEVKENLLGVNGELIAEKTAVCEEVAVEMGKGACRALNTDYAIAATGIAGPAGGTPEIPVGTIWLACGDRDNVTTHLLKDDYGRDVNLSIATNKALEMFLDFLKNDETPNEDDGESQGEVKWGAN